VAEYLRTYTKPGALRAGSAYYRAVSQDVSDNQKLEKFDSARAGNRWNNLLRTRCGSRGIAATNGLKRPRSPHRGLRALDTGRKTRTSGQGDYRFPRCNSHTVTLFAASAATRLCRWSWCVWKTDGNGANLLRVLPAPSWCIDVGVRVALALPLRSSPAYTRPEEPAAEEEPQTRLRALGCSGLLSTADRAAHPHPESTTKAGDS
jgi:hypothetical protein